MILWLVGNLVIRLRRRKTFLTPYKKEYEQNGSQSLSMAVMVEIDILDDKKYISDKMKTCKTKTHLSKPNICNFVY